LSENTAREAPTVRFFYSKKKEEKRTSLRVNDMLMTCSKLRVNRGTTDKNQQKTCIGKKTMP
jgi:hypothetical protein